MTPFSDLWLYVSLVQVSSQDTRTARRTSRWLLGSTPEYSGRSSKGLVVCYISIAADRDRLAQISGLWLEQRGEHILAAG